MTTLEALGAGRSLSTAGRRPGSVVMRWVARKTLVSGISYGIVFALYVVAQTFAYVSAYKTQAARDQLAIALSGNVGVNALIGPARAINTVAGYSSWRALGVLSLLGGIWGLLLSTKYLRGEEEAGRYELLLAGQTTRRRASVQTLLALGCGWVALLAVTAAGTVATGRAASVGFGIGESLYLALALASGAAEFLAVGALASQLVSTRRRAMSIAGAVFGVSYALRMVGDSAPRMHWLVWLSPLGWIEESRPLSQPRPWALLPVLGVIVIATAVTVHLAGTRDAGAATLADHDTARPHLRLLHGSTSLAIRLMRPTVIGWLAGVAAFALLIGTVAESAAKAVTSNNPIAKALERLGGHANLVSAYLGLTFLILAMMISLVAAGQVTAIRAEEAEGRLEHLLVRSIGRSSWFAGRFGLSAAVLLFAGCLAGASAWLGASSQHSVVRFGALFSAGLNVVPPAIFLLGLGALTLGAWPRSTTTVVYGYLAWSFLVEFVGAVVRASHWILDTSVFFHIAPAPATSPHWLGDAVLTGLGILGSVIGAVQLRRRDLVST